MKTETDNSMDCFIWVLAGQEILHNNDYMMGKNNTWTAVDVILFLGKNTKDNMTKNNNNKKVCAKVVF